jgi:ABC-type transport system substrate-binding protein
MLVLMSVAMAVPAFAADLNKVIRDVFPAAETGFDPAASNDLYSGTINSAIFDTLYTYDYLARPAKLTPLAAETLPQVTDNGKTYTIKLRKGVMFAPDPAFGGKKRELVAEDVVYSLKRLADPKLRSPWVFLVEGKFVGLDEEIAAAMECPVGTVRSRIFRAREAIDKRLREVFEGGLGRTEEMV